MTEEIIAELDDLQQEIESAKTEKAQSEGKLEAALSALKKEFKIDDEKLGQEEYERLLKRELSLEELFQDQFKKLKEEYQW